MRRHGLAAIVFAYSAAGALAWESNYPSLPVNVDSVDFNITAETLVDESSGLAIGFGRPRTISYPVETGAKLGLGWDFVDNVQSYADCVNFALIDERKSYQDAELTVREVADKDTLDLALNAEFSGKVGGTIKAVKGSVSSRGTIDASHHVSTTDLAFVAHASVTSGISFAAPAADPVGRVSLKADMRRLAIEDPAEFRERCGDGYVASIGYGSDLYILFNFHSLTTDDRLKLSHQGNASAGMGDIFSGEGKSAISVTINRLRDEQKLDVHFVQRGGHIEQLPVSLEQAKAAVNGLPKQELEGPKPIFLTVVPYSQLSNWPGIFWSDSTDLKQRAIRYLKRQGSILYEILNIRENYFRPRMQNFLQGDEYVYGYYHNLRVEDFPALEADVHQEIKRTQALLALLDSAVCDPEPVSPSDARSARNDLRIADRNCKDAIDRALQGLNFDDFKFWIRLPLPINSTLAAELQKFGKQDVPIENRRVAFAQVIYRHWVERIDQARCRAFVECLSEARRASIYGEILGGLNEDGTLSTYPESSASQKLMFCTGEFDNGCMMRYGTKGDYRVLCGESLQDKSRKICVEQYGAYHSTVRRLAGPDVGNGCGYSLEEITCYSYAPSFP